MFRKSALAFAATSLLGLAFNAPAALAQESTPVHVRGTVVSLASSMLTVATREGATLEVTLSATPAVSSVIAAEVSDIKIGDYVGITSLPQADGSDGALNVLIFPAALKGTAEGSSAWDLQPSSSMTNATVADAVTDIDGRIVKVSYNGEDKDISIPEATPVVAIGPGAVGDLVPGATVFIFAEQTPDGVVARQVIVGKNGVVPPM